MSVNAPNTKMTIIRLELSVFNYEQSREELNRDPWFFQA